MTKAESTNNAKSTVKDSVLTLVKLGFAFGLVYWMWDSGRIDFLKITDILNDGFLLSLTIGVWLLTQGVGSIRWIILLHALGYKLKPLRAFQLHMTGLFFNTAMPGAVGGDLIKATYVILDNKNLGKSPAMTSILMDRILGLYGLFTIGAVVILMNYDMVLQTPALQPVALFVLSLVLGTGVFLYLISKNYKGADPFLKILEKGFPGSRIASRIYKTLRLFQNNQKDLFFAWVMSMIIQGALMGYFCILTRALLPEAVDLTAIAMIFPIGILVTALPVAPGGLGVGHVAFEKLFAIVGSDGGATIFNAYILSTLCLNLLGIFGYISLGKKKSPQLVSEVIEPAEKAIQ